MNSPIAALLSSSRWVEDEFSELSLGDQRRNERVRSMFQAMAINPSGSLPESLVDRASIKAAYRMLHKKELDFGDVLFCHANKAFERAAESLTRAGSKSSEVILLIQDSTQIDYSSHLKTTGLGTLQMPGCLGFMAHNTLVASETGEVFGLGDQQLWARDPEEFGKRHLRKSLPIEEKESRKWLLGVRAMEFLAEKLPDQTVVFVADREADIYDLFLLPRSDNHHLLIRANHDRSLVEEELRLWPFMDAQPVRGTMIVDVPGGHGKKERQAKLSIRYAKIQLQKPKKRSKLEEAPPVWVVYAGEEPPLGEASSGEPSDGSPSGGKSSIAWMLLCTHPVESQQDAERCVRWYSQRWKVEMFHRILKSGCNVEDCRLCDAMSLMRYITMQSIVACRVLFCMTTGREHPERPCTDILEEDEWKALYCVTHKTKDPPTTPPRLGDAVLWIARLAGYTGSPLRSPPGAQLIQRGLERLADLTLGYTLVKTLDTNNCG